MFDVFDDTEAQEDVAESRREAVPEVDTVPGQGEQEETDEPTLEEAGYGYGV